MNFLFNGELIVYDFFKICENNLEKNTNNIKNNINKKINSSNETILFLHGWGGDKNSFKSTINLLKHKFNILTVTMPTITDTVVFWSLIDYANLILYLCKLYSLSSINIVCHSFGFRVANLIKQHIEIKKIVVTGGAGLKKFSLLKKLNLNNNKILLKQSRFNYLYNSIASADYKALSPTNKKIFSAVVGVVFNKLCKFNSEMLLFWGKHDKETKIWIAKKLKRENNAKLIVTKFDHFAYLKENARFNNEVLNFL